MYAWILIGLVVVVAVGLTRPWRFWWKRRYCPQCNQLLPRWDFWGWKLDWTCRNCGCQIRR